MFILINLIIFIKLNINYINCNLYYICYYLLISFISNLIILLFYIKLFYNQFNIFKETAIKKFLDSFD
jgi:hypothetical protein